MSKRILVVEDDYQLRDLLRIVLRDEGFEVETVPDGQAAMDNLTAGKGAHTLPAMIILDLNMPEIDGFTFLENFESLPEKIRSISKIVVLTSSNSVKDREQVFLNKNVIQFITKPLKQSDIEELQKKLSAAK